MTEAVPSSLEPVRRYPESPADGGPTVFPLGLRDSDLIEEALLRGVTPGDQRSFVEVREDGAASDLVTTFYGAHFDAWHVEAGRLPAEAPEDVLLYKIAGLYGMRIASDARYARTGERITADDSLAYAVARAAILESYDVSPADAGLSTWEVEKHREAVHTGSDVLSLVLAFAYDRIVAQYSELYGTVPDVPDERIYNALNLGLIDGAIFFNTYLRARENYGKELFIEATMHTVQRSDAELSDQIEVAGPPFKVGDDRQTSQHFLRAGESVRLFEELVGGGVLVRVPVVVQVRPGVFARAFALQEFDADDDRLGGLFDEHAKQSKRETAADMITAKRLRLVLAVGVLAGAGAKAATEWAAGGTAPEIVGEAFNGAYIGLFAGFVAVALRIATHARQNRARQREMSQRMTASFTSDGSSAPDSQTTD